jgi:hypothetical protein
MAPNANDLVFVVRAPPGHFIGHRDPGCDRQSHRRAVRLQGADLRGLAIATLLTLVLVPALYVIAIRDLRVIRWHDAPHAGYQRLEDARMSERPTMLQLPPPRRRTHATAMRPDLRGSSRDAASSGEPRARARSTMLAP